MSVDYDAFLGWAESRFDDIIVSGKEIKLNSIFVDDKKHHLWTCPEKGIYHCWKSDAGGTLTQLVSLVDNCSYQEAAEKIGSKYNNNNSISYLEKKLKSLQTTVSNPKNIITLPSHTIPITSLSKENYFRKMAENYINSRKLAIGNLMVCVDGEHKNRIVIPYYNKADELIYWNSRDLTGNAYLRYKGPKKEEVGVGKEDVLWVDQWSVNKLYLTEGEFDAMSINLTGLHGAACGGKNVSEKQMQILKDYHVSIAFDTDKSGAMALNTIGKIYEHYPKDMKLTYIRPPKKYKDWNEMLIDAGPRVMKTYIDQNEKVLDGSWTVNSLIFKSWQR